MTDLEAMFGRVHSGQSIWLYREANVAYMEGAEHIVKHSPTGIEWGYCGSGPADLSRSILAHWAGLEVANRLYQKFKFDVISDIPTEGREITRQEVIEWIEYGSNKS